MPTLPSGLLILAAALSIGACGDDGGPSDGTSSAQPGPVLPNNLSSVISLDTVAATAVLPLYRGEDMAGNAVYFIITESNKIDESVRLGLNWTPKLVHALRTKAVQQATATTGGGGANPNNFPVVQFSGNVDFSPTRNLVPGPQLFPLDPSTTPGSVGDADYSPVFTLDTTGDTTTAIVYNAPHVANGTGLHDRVISIDTVGMQVTMKLVKGFYEGFPILYASTDVSDNDLAALEMGTFTPNLNETPFPGDDKPFRSAREAIIPVINGPTGIDNPSRQGLQSAVLGEGDPLNIFQEQAGCANPSDPSQFCDAVLYSPLWDATPVKWTQAAIDAGIRDRITSDKREVIAPLNIIDLLADGYLEPGTPGGARNSSLGGLPAAGIIINCPIIFVEEPSR